MNFEFLFQNNEGVFNLIKRKTKILLYISLAGIITSVLLTVVFIFDINQSRFIPGIISLGGIFVLNIILLTRGNYSVSLRVFYLLPVVIYFFYINPHFSIVGIEDSLRGILGFAYLSLIFFFFFGNSIVLFLVFFSEMVVTLFLYFYLKGLPINFFSANSSGLFFPINPVIELAIFSFIAALVYNFFSRAISHAEREKARVTEIIEESLHQVNVGIMQLKIIRDEQGEKAGMKILRTNYFFEKIFKVSKAEITGADYSEIFPLIFRNSFDWQDVYFHSRKTSFQFYIEHSDKWFNVFNVFPQPDMIISCFTNISDLKYEIRKLQLRENRLTSLMGSLPDIFFIIEKDGTYVDYVTNNPELMKMTQADIIGKTIFEMGFSKAMAYQIYSSIQYVIENDNIETIEYGMELSGGKILIFEMRIARLNENQVISIGRDITASKECENQLIEARKRTEEANRLKSSFLENISHEIRTPMNAILGFSSMAVSDKYPDDERKKFIEIVQKNGEYLMDVITNIIDISEIESRVVEYNPQFFRINDLFLSIYNKYKKVNDGRVQLRLEIGVDSPDFTVFSDPFLLQKIMNHIVENSFKFTKEGIVSLGYAIEGNLIKIFTKDTGIGIEKKDYATIFEYFRQVDNRVSRTYSGTGVGLTIVKNLTEILGSKIEFESQPGKGSTFFFYLPLKE